MDPTKIMAARSKLKTSGEHPAVRQKPVLQVGHPRK
jgi:hypothetical protein